MHSGSQGEETAGQNFSSAKTFPPFYPMKDVALFKGSQKIAAIVKKNYLNEDSVISHDIVQLAVGHKKILYVFWSLLAPVTIVPCKILCMIDIKTNWCRFSLPQFCRNNI